MGRASGGSATFQHVEIVVGLRWRDQSDLEELLRGLSNPDSYLFGRYLSAEEFDGRFAPSADTIEATKGLLRAQGLEIDDVTPSGLFLTASGWVENLETLRANLLAALRDLTQEIRLYFYVQADDGNGAGSAAGNGGVVAQGDGAVTLHPRIEIAPRAVVGAAGFGPPDIAQAYEFTNLYDRGIDGRPARSSRIAIATAYGFAPDDVRSFWSAWGINRGDDSVELVWVDQPTDATHIETTVDVEWASALAPEAPVLVYATPEASGHGFLKVYDRIVTENRAAVFVTSWGACEQQLSRTYLEQAHIVFQRAAAQGITVIAASGDRGSDDCGSGEASVDFPAADPNVLAVGGTSLAADGSGADERVWRGSGGGTSTIWPAPSWQMNPSPYRVLADVAFNATGFSSRFNGHDVIVGGTSLGAPSWAALVALANDSRATIGDTSLGVAAPALCEVAHAPALPESPFKDVASDDNGSNAALSGWDFATGWGSPHGQALVDALVEAIPRALTTANAERGIIVKPMRAGTGDLRAQLLHLCARTALRLRGRDLIPGDYIVSFSAVPVASFTVGTSARIDTTLHGRDVRGTLLEVTRDGERLFASEFPVEQERGVRVGLVLNDTGLVGNASGIALYRRGQGRERFSMRIRNVSPGTYAVRAAGVRVAEMTVSPGQATAHIRVDSLAALGMSRGQNPLCDTLAVVGDAGTVLYADRSARSAELCP